MKNIPSIKRIIAITNSAIFILLAVSAVFYSLHGVLITNANAQEASGAKSGTSAGHRGSSGAHGQKQGGKNATSTTIIKGQGGSGEESDSDRPTWAGQKGGKSGGGTKPTAAGTKKGDLYGDLYIIQRNPDGTPVLDQYGHVIPLAADNTPIYLTPEGDLPEGAIPQTVEFSRLSVSRSSTKVIDKQLAEAEKTILESTKITFDSSGRIAYTNADGTTATIDSPLENLALYQAILKNNGVLTLPTATGSITLNLTNAASFLGAASDKSGSVSIDTVEYLNPVLGIDGTIKYTDGKSYYDFSSFSYNQATTYDQKIKVGTINPDNTVTWTETTLANAVFKTPTTTNLTNADGFAQAADDSRAVILYLHDTPLVQFVQ